MTRDELKELGIEADKIDAIMNLHGKSTNKVKAERDEYSTKLTEAQDQLTKRDADIEKLKSDTSASEDLKLKLDTISAEYEDYKNTYAEREAQFKLDSAMKVAIAKSGTIDEISLLANLNKDSLKLNEDGNLDGFEDQLTKLQESKPFLFGTSTDGGLDLNKPPKTKTIEEQIKQGLKRK